VTLLGAVIGEGHVLVGADGRSMEQGEGTTGHASGRHLVAEKLHPVPDQPLIWGLSGLVTSGEAFGPWVANQGAKSWQDFESLATVEVARINGKIRDEFRTAFGMSGANLPPIQGVAVLIAGYIGCEAGIMRISDCAIPDRTHDDQPQFLGPFATTTSVAWTTVQRFRGELSPAHPAVFARLLEAVSDAVVGLWLPISLWRVVPDGPQEKLR
jgi:hypothetical protein